MNRRRKLWLVSEAAVVALAVKIGLRLVSFGTVNTGLKTLGARWSVLNATNTELNEIYRVGSYVVATLPGRDTCLVRALTVRTLLSCYSYRSELRIGVRPDLNKGNLHAHAWLERPDGAVLTLSGSPAEFVRLRSES